MDTQAPVPQIVTYTQILEQTVNFSFQQNALKDKLIEDLQKQIVDLQKQLVAKA